MMALAPGKGCFPLPGPPARRDPKDPRPESETGGPGMPGSRPRHSTAVDPQPENLNLGAAWSSSVGGTLTPSGANSTELHGVETTRPTVEGADARLPFQV